jgi:hypothetical protein
VTPAPSGSAPPIPVVVLDDPTNPWDVAALIVGLIVGTVSIWLAWRAIRIGRQANHEASQARAAIAAERRRTFELEVLKDLADLLDEDARTPDRTDSLTFRLASSPSLITDSFQSRLRLLPDTDLTTWRRAAEARTAADLGRQFGMARADAERRYTYDGGRIEKVQASPALVERLVNALHEDVFAAIDRRMRATDD